MRPRDHDIFARELRQQLIPCRRSRGWVDVEDHCDFRMLQLDALCMNGVAPKQDFVSFRRKFIAGMSGGMTVQRNKLHAVHNRLGATERVPPAGLDVRRCDGLRALEKRLRILRRLGGAFRRQPEVAIFLRDVDLA